MSSYSSLLPTAARSVLSSCRSPLRQGPMAPFVSTLNQQIIRGKKTAPPKVMKDKDREREKAKTAANRRANKGSKTFKQTDTSKIQQYSLCDAIRYIRAFEVGQDLTNVKYELHVRLRSMKDGPTIRNMLRFPHSVQPDSRICVICPPGTRIEKEARAAGAVLVGEADVFEAIKAGRIEFDRCIAHPDSVSAMNKAGMGRILGPRGLMPNEKQGTVVDDVASRVEMLRGGTVYRERAAVIRLPIGQVAFTPEQLRDNLRVTIAQIKKDAAAVTDRFSKEIHEIVLSSTHGPGFSLNGEFESETSDVASLRGL